MRIPAGELIPDSGNDDGSGCGGILIVLVILWMMIDNACDYRLRQARQQSQEIPTAEFSYPYNVTSKSNELGMGRKVERDMTALQSPSSIVTVPDQPHFVARDYFKIDTSNLVRVKIARLGWGFEDYFLEKVEDHVEESEFEVYRLNKNFFDEEIRDKLEVEKRETTLSQLWAMLEKQGHGQNGELLTDGYANIFYIRDARNVLLDIRLSWSAGDGGWYLCANVKNRTSLCRQGRQVISHK